MIGLIMETYFSHVIQYYFKDCVDKIIFCSTTKSDLSKFGGVPTKSFRSLFNAKIKDDNFLIVAGGDSLFIDWQTILSFVDPYAKFFYIADNFIMVQSIFILLCIRR